MRANLAIGAALTFALVVAGLAAPTFLRGAVNTLFPLLLIALGGALLVMGGVRRIVLGPAAALSLGALVTVALVFQWQPRFDLVQSFLLALIGFVAFSMTVKVVLNAQMLIRH